MSGHMRLGKRMENCIYWHRTFSMRRSTQRLLETRAHSIRINAVDRNIGRVKKFIGNSSPSGYVRLGQQMLLNGESSGQIAAVSFSPPYASF